MFLGFSVQYAQAHARVFDSGQRVKGTCTDIPRANWKTDVPDVGIGSTNLRLPKYWVNGDGAAAARARFAEPECSNGFCL